MEFSLTGHQYGITIATPGDFDLDNSLLAVWTKTMKEDLLLDTLEIYLEYS